MHLKTPITFSETDKVKNETATWLHVYQMGPPSWGGIQCDEGITGSVPIT